MRRLPKRPSQFTKTKEVPLSTARQRGVVPKQTKLSVQDVRTYETQAGASMSNEEMRRLRLWADNGNAAVEEAGGSGDGGNKPYAKSPNTPGGDTAKVATELTVEHNNHVVVSKTTKILDFHDINAGPSTEMYGGDWFEATNRWKITKIGNDQAVIYARPRVPLHQYRVGQIALNKIPVDYTGNGFLDDEYKKNKFRYKGYYSGLNVQFGHIVYAEIRHDFKLKNLNHFNLHLIDRNEGGLDDPDSMLYPDQVSIVQVEGWDDSRIVIYGILKPERYVYTGVTHPEPALQLANLDDPTTALTNAIFDYVLIKGE